jgi:hypothetical protein
LYHFLNPPPTKLKTICRLLTAHRTSTIHGRSADYGSTSGSENPHLDEFIEWLPDGEFLTESQSPTGEYTVKAYVSMSGATVANAVRGEVVYHQKKDKKKNIYWGYRESTAKVVWIDEHTVSINDMVLDVHKDVYDFRKE